MDPPYTVYEAGQKFLSFLHHRSSQLSPTHKCQSFVFVIQIIHTKTNCCILKLNKVISSHIQLTCLKQLYFFYSHGNSLKLPQKYENIPVYIEHTCAHTRSFKTVLSSDLCHLKMHVLSTLCNASCKIFQAKCPQIKHLKALTMEREFFFCFVFFLDV